MTLLLEIKRKEHIQSSKNSDLYKGDKSKGKNRYERRLHQKVLKSTKELNSIDMNKFFKLGILDVDIRVTGETNDYTVTVSFGELLDDIYEELLKNNNELTLRVLTRAIIKSFNESDVRLRCTCPDFKFRIAHPLSVKDAIYGEPETRPADITNPNDTKGNGCKHIMMVLTNNRWCLSLASVIFNYINYMEKHLQNAYAKVIYPAIYRQDYTEPTLIGLFDTDELAGKQSKDDIEKSQIYAQTKNYIQKGWNDANRSTTTPGQQSLDFDRELDNV